MIYYTGDIHGDPYEVIQFCDSKKLTEQDKPAAHHTPKPRQTAWLFDFHRDAPI